MTPTINAVGVVAADVDATVAFYERLGCAFKRFGDWTHVEAELGGFRLMVVSAATMGEGAAGEGVRAGSALAAQAGTPAEVDELYWELSACGRGILEPFGAPWGQ